MIYPELTTLKVSKQMLKRIKSRAKKEGKTMFQLTKETLLKGLQK